MIAARVRPMRADHNYPRAIVARCDDNDRCGAITVVVGTGVSMVIRLADHDVTAEVRIPEAERNPDAGLGARDPG
jgi:hypothetical protein